MSLVSDGITGICILLYLQLSIINTPRNQQTFHTPQNSCRHRLYKIYHLFLYSRYEVTTTAVYSLTSSSELGAIGPIDEVRVLYM